MFTTRLWKYEILLAASNSSIIWKFCEQGEEILGPFKAGSSLVSSFCTVGFGGFLESLSVSQLITQLFSYLLILFISEWSSNQLNSRHALRYLATCQRSTWYLSAPQTSSSSYSLITVGCNCDEQNYTADYFLTFLSYPACIHQQVLHSSPLPHALRAN